MLTIEQAITRYGVDIDEHLDRQATIPVHDGLQCQGDVAVVPQAMTRRHHLHPATTPVPSAGVPVVRGEAGGNTHLLLGQGDVFWDGHTGGPTDLRLGTLTVATGAVAYLAHPEHAYAGIAPGTYEVRRQREQADEIRIVAD